MAADGTASARAGVRVAWARGGEARILALSAGAISLSSTVPWPPGSRVEGALRAEGLAPAGSVAPALRIKVHASRKAPDGDYLVEGRPIDMARTVRERLEALVHSTPT